MGRYYTDETAKGDKEVGGEIWIHDFTMMSHQSHNDVTSICTMRFISLSQQLHNECTSVAQCFSQCSLTTISHLPRGARRFFSMSAPPATEQAGTEQNDFISISHRFHTDFTMVSHQSHDDFTSTARSAAFLFICAPPATEQPGTRHQAPAGRAPGTCAPGTKHLGTGHRAKGHREPAGHRRRHTHESKLVSPAASTLGGIIAARMLPRSFASPARTARTTRTETEIDFPVGLTPQPPI